MLRRLEGHRAWEDSAGLLRTVSHPVRLCVLDVLREGPKSVADINGVVDVVQPNLSQHLAVLREAGLVASHADGPRRLYYLLRPSFVEALLILLVEDHPSRQQPRAQVVAAVNGAA
jgi:DNA-binding transcriptional ArsR family regulator